LLRIRGPSEIHRALLGSPCPGPMYRLNPFSYALVITTIFSTIVRYRGKPIMVFFNLLDSTTFIKGVALKAESSREQMYMYYI